MDTEENKHLIKIYDACPRKFRYAYLDKALGIERKKIKSTLSQTIFSAVLTLICLLMLAAWIAWMKN